MAAPSSMKSKASNSKRSIALAMVLFLIAAVAGAQTDTGKIAGSITDPTGAAVVGATVSATNEQNGLAKQDTSDASGHYDLPELPAGRYTLTVTFKGFQTSKLTNVVLDAASSREVPFKLVVGQVNQEVVVTSVAENQVNTADAQIASTLSGKQIDDISLNGRNYVQLMRLLPGVVSTTLDPFTIQLSSMSSYVTGFAGPPR